MQDNTTEDVDKPEDNNSAVCEDVLKLSSNTMSSTENVSEQINLVQSTSDNEGKSEAVPGPQDVASERPSDSSADEKDVNLKEGLGLGNRQQSLEEELLMEEELLKGEDDEADANLNSDDLILEEESVVESVAGSQNSNIAQQNVLDLEINIDSLLGSTSGAPDNSVDIEINEAELLNEDTVSEMATGEKKCTEATNMMAYDEDSLLRELEGNINVSQDVVLDENIDSLLVAGDSQTIVGNKIDENISNSESSMPLERDVDYQMDENALFVSCDGSKQTNMYSSDDRQDNSLIVDTQMLEDSKSTPMEENSTFVDDVDTGQSIDTPMEENALLMDETEAEQEAMDSDGQDETIYTPMEENVLLNEDENMEERPTIIEHSEITIDENNLLDEDTEFNLDSEVIDNENVLLTDNENTNLSVQDSNIAGEINPVIDKNVATESIGETCRLPEPDSNQNSNDCGEHKAGLEIKINSVASASIDDVINELDRNKTDANEELECNDDTTPLINENIAVSPGTVLNDEESEVEIRECDQLTSDDLIEDHLVTVDGESYNVLEPRSDGNEDDETRPLIEQEELSLSNEFPENETEFNAQEESEDFDESIVKEEVLENEYEEDYLATKHDGDFNDANRENYETEYDVGDTVVKEEMADIETLVDVKQEVLEESDHLALDHNIKQEFLHSDGIKEEYSGDETGNTYFNDEKGLDGKADNFMDVVPVSLKRSDDFCDLKPDASDEMIVPASMIISASDIQSMQGKNMDSKGGEEIIISDKCVDVANLNDIAMDVENDGDSLLAPRSFACSVCHREYQSISTLQRHEKIHENEGGVVTNVMHNDDISVLRGEANLEAVEGVYNCTCGKSFKRRSSVVACMKTHRMRGIWCEHCGMSFRRQRELRSHIVRVHTKSPKIKKPRCNICNKEFAHQKSLVRHSKLHLKDVDLTDSVNEVSDTDNENLTNFNCELCNLEFNSKSELLSHKSIAHPLDLTAEDSSVLAQTKEPQQPSLKLKFNCKTCKKVFLTLGSLASHKALHSKKANKMKFRCERCAESFQTRSELSSHRRLHCRGVLHHYSALQYIADRETIRASKLVKCDVCAQTYSNKEEMETHRDATHPFVTFSKEDATETRIFFK